jgi:hypothetical protein
MTSWAVAMRRFPQMPLASRLPYFLGFAMTLWLTSLSCTVLGHALAETLPPPLRLAFIFGNPIYFIPDPHGGSARQAGRGRAGLQRLPVRCCIWSGGVERRWRRPGRRHCGVPDHAQSSWLT